MSDEIYISCILHLTTSDVIAKITSNHHDNATSTQEFIDVMQHNPSLGRVAGSENVSYKRCAYILENVSQRTIIISNTAK
jgi:hypothetical protein